MKHSLKILAAFGLVAIIIFGIEAKFYLHQRDLHQNYGIVQGQIREASTHCVYNSIKNITSYIPCAEMPAQSHKVSETRYEYRTAVVYEYRSPLDKGLYRGKAETRTDIGDTQPEVGDKILIYINKTKTGVSEIVPGGASRH